MRSFSILQLYLNTEVTEEDNTYSAFLCEDLGFTSAVSSAKVKVTAEEGPRTPQRPQRRLKAASLTKSNTSLFDYGNFRSSVRTVSSGILLLAEFENGRRQSPAK
jgi:hypothetical protein